MHRTVFLAALVLILTTAQVHAEDFLVSVGIQTVSFGSDVGKYWNIPSGPGVILNIGFPPFMGVPFDFTIGRRSTNEENTNDDVTYRWMEAGPRFYIGRRGERIRPEIFAGAGFYNLDIGDINFDGATGFYVGFGIEDLATEHLIGRFQIKNVYWQSDTGTIDGASLNFVLMYGYRF